MERFQRISSTFPPRFQQGLPLKQLALCQVFPRRLRACMSWFPLQTRSLGLAWSSPSGRDSRFAHLGFPALPCVGASGNEGSVSASFAEIALIPLDFRRSRVSLIVCAARKSTRRHGRTTIWLSCPVGHSLRELADLKGLQALPALNYGAPNRGDSVQSSSGSSEATDESHRGWSLPSPTSPLVDLWPTERRSFVSQAGVLPWAEPTVLGSARSNVGPGVHGGGACAQETSPKEKFSSPNGGTQAPNFPGLWVQLPSTGPRLPSFDLLQSPWPTFQGRREGTIFLRAMSHR